MIILSKQVKDNVEYSVLKNDFRTLRHVDIYLNSLQNRLSCHFKVNTARLKHAVP